MVRTNLMATGVLESILLPTKKLRVRERVGERVVEQHSRGCEKVE